MEETVQPGQRQEIVLSLDERLNINRLEANLRDVCGRIYPDVASAKLAYETAHSELLAAVHHIATTKHGWRGQPGDTAIFTSGEKVN